MVATPITVFTRSLQNTKVNYLGHIYIGNLFYILCGHFDEKKWGTTLPGGKGKPSKSEGEGVVATIFIFLIF